MKPYFIGLGAQRSGTSWIYACLYEHPQLHMPFKEVNFFGRDEQYEKGLTWYENHFSGQPEGKLSGEFSTTYLDSDVAPGRIYKYHPEVKLIVSLRNPVERALSNYYNNIMGGLVGPEVTFDEALDVHPEYLTQGMYHQQLQNYLEYFPREQLLVLIYEDSIVTPIVFIQGIYRFLDVDSKFRPSMIEEKVNVGRKPKSVKLDLALDAWANALRRKGLHRFIWFIKRIGFVKLLRQANSGQLKESSDLSESRRAQLKNHFRDDIKRLEVLLNRDLAMWIND